MEKRRRNSSAAFTKKNQNILFQKQILFNPAEHRRRVNAPPILPACGLN
jgi:hypothetical protein